VSEVERHERGSWLAVESRFGSARCCWRLEDVPVRIVARCSSGRVASDQHHPASSRAMPMVATVCFFFRSL
jgi:hypothetical protein